MNDLKKLIREVPDYPKPGILFYDLTTLLKDKQGFHMLIDRLCEHYNGHTIDVVAGIEARGFIFAPALAYRLATGGTAAATAKLIQQLGGTVEGAAFAVELTFLNGRKKLNGLDVFSLIQYDK